MVFNSSNLGGGFNGISPTVTINTQQGNSNVAPAAEASQIPLDRMYLRKAFPTNTFRNKYILTNKWAQTPFRVAMNAGDLLVRQTEPGGTNQVKGSVGIGQYRNTLGTVDGVRKGDGASGNQHYVYDSSVYTTYKRRVSKNKNYNDKSFVGNEHNGSYTAIKAIRRF
jgi:hypothetical protein